MAGNISNAKNVTNDSSPVQGEIPFDAPSPTGGQAQSDSTTAEQQLQDDKDNPDFTADDLADLQNLDNNLGNVDTDNFFDTGDSYDFNDDDLSGLTSELIFDDIRVNNLSVVEQTLRPDQRAEFDALASAGAIKLHC